jgi:hypothetical protein
MEDAVSAHSGGDQAARILQVAQNRFVGTPRSGNLFRCAGPDQRADFQTALL